MDVSGAFGVVGDKVRGELKGGDIEGSEHALQQLNEVFKHRLCGCKCDHQTYVGRVT